eukprot:TRINITY_DN5921_c0_g1_i8.p1 TRINITY_DN5921_c0_g1~~TRINITY_DN5921_c0_g1_i8.p1  ORF type:complete len:271 (+),score=95.12 TRINITY_DN5921_c0_g1_i8:122-934(+)
MLRSLVGSEMCIRDSINAEYGGRTATAMIAVDLIVIGGFAISYGLVWLFGEPESSYQAVGICTATVGALLVVGTGLYLSSEENKDDYYEYMLVFEISIMMLGLTWYKSAGDMGLVKMAELLVTAAFGLSVQASEEDEERDTDGISAMRISTLTPHMDAKEVAWCAFLVALTAVMYVAQPGIRNRKLGALAWILLGEWMLLESMFEEHHKDSDKLFGAAHWSALLCLNWVCFLFFKGDLGFERGDQIEHASLVSRPPTGGRNYTEDSRQLF